ncbi:MAG: M56 family metallopeptidase [Clostridia bacterium]|nr:M56 family metallopeptidase [Clostridia bacterium]
MSMTAVIFLLLMLNRAAGARFTAKCRYILWCVVILRLAIPVGAPFSASLIRVEVPDPAVITIDADSADAPETSAPDPVTETSAVPEKTSMTETGFTQAEPDASSHVKPAETVSTPLREPEPAETEGEPVSVPVSMPAETEDGIGFTPARDMLVPEMPEETAKRPVNLPDTGTLLDLSTIVWLTGAAGFFLTHWIQHAVTVASLRRSRRTVSREMHGMYGEMCSLCRVKKRPNLYASAEITSPILFGYFRPCILLPLNVNDPEKAAGILRHELTHWKRGDLWIKLACLTAQSLHWFNPMVHLAAGRCAREMELSCDEAVLDGLGERERQAYGLIMLDVVRFCRSRQTGLTTQFNPKRSVVRERFENILDMRRKNRGPALIAMVTAVCLCVPMIVSCTVRSEADFTPDAVNPAEPAAEKTIGTHMPAGEERVVLGAAYKKAKTAAEAGQKMLDTCRIEYGDFLDTVAAYGKSMEKLNVPAAISDDADQQRETAEKARLLRAEINRSIAYLNETVPGALFANDGLTVTLPADVLGRAVMLPGDGDSVFAVGYSYDADENAVREIFRIERYPADGLTPVNPDADMFYFAWDGWYFYALTHPWYVQNELRDACFAHIRSNFVLANDGVYAMSDSRVRTITDTLASASYETCLENMKSGIWAPSVVIHSDVVRSMSAKLVNRVIEYLGDGKPVGGITVTGAQLDGVTSESITLTLPEGAGLPEPVSAQDVNSYFVHNRYDPEDCSCLIPMDEEYVLSIRFLFRENALRITRMEILHQSELPALDRNTPSAELYAMYHAGKLTQTELLSYPAVHADISRIAEEVFLGLDGTAPKMSTIRDWFTGYPDGTIELIAIVSGDTDVSVRMEIGDGMELVSSDTGRREDIAVSYKALYDLYASGAITEYRFYDSPDVQIMVAEMFSTVFDALRRGEDANALWNTPGFTPPAVLPEGITIKGNMTRDMYINNNREIWISCPAYDTERIQINPECHLQIWYEITAGGLRPISSMIYEPHIRYSTEPLGLSILYPDYVNGKREMEELIGQRDVQTNLLALYRRACTSLKEAGFDAILPADMFRMISTTARIPEYVAYTAQGTWAVCVTSGGKILEIGFEIRTDGTPRTEITTITLLESGKTDRTLLLQADVNGMTRPCAVTIPADHPYRTAEIASLAEARGILALTHGTDVTYTDIALTGETGGVMWFEAE